MVLMFPRVCFWKPFLYLVFWGLYLGAISSSGPPLTPEGPRKPNLEFANIQEESGRGASQVSWVSPRGEPVVDKACVAAEFRYKSAHTSQKRAQVSLHKANQCPARKKGSMTNPPSQPNLWSSRQDWSCLEADLTS